MPRRQASQLTVTNRRDQTGLQQRRLPRSGRADDDLDPTARGVQFGKSVHQFGSKFGATKIPVRILRSVVFQAAVWFQVIRSAPSPRVSQRPQPLPDGHLVGDATYPQDMCEDLLAAAAGQ